MYKRDLFSVLLASYVASTLKATKIEKHLQQFQYCVFSFKIEEGVGGLSYPK